MNTEFKVIELIRKRIKELCQERKLSYYKLSKKSHVLTSTLNSIMNGTNNDIKISTIKKLSDGLAISLNEFFDEVNFK